MKELSNEAPPPSGDFNQGFQLDGNNNLYNYPHKGIFHPEPNTLICRGNCCFKYVGLYPMLFGLKFVVSYPMIEIITSSLFTSKSKIVNISEIGNIIFEYKFSYTKKRGGIYQSLHIMYTNGEQTDYFGFNTSPPCFTQYEVDYFNKEIKKLLRK